MIFWAGTASDDVRVVVEHYPAQPLPTRKLEAVSVPGRNGDVLFIENAFENIEQEYDIYVSAERPRLPVVARAVAAWLYGSAGYQRLEDSYDLDHYRIAYYEGPTDIENVLNRFGRATIAFNCKPQRYLKAGENAVQLTAAGELRNPTAFDALPLLRIYGSGEGALNIGAYSVTVSDIDGYIDIDCETQNAYKGGENLNAGVAFSPDCPRLVPGVSAVSWSGGVTSIQITPRWWEL